MKKLIPLILLLALLSAGCAPVSGTATISDVPESSPPAAAEAAPDTSPPSSEPTPSPSAEPSTSFTPESTPSPSAEPAPSSAPSPTPKSASYDYTAPVPETEAVDDGWFAGAVFIGDSRTDGLRLYSGISGADFLCYKGLTIFEVLDDKPVIQTEGGNIGVLQALEQKQYARIYLALGVNELGYYNDQGFADAYRSVVEQLKVLQPDADIYLQSLIPVNEEVCRETNQPSYITNAQIAVYNGILTTVAAEEEVFYVNVQEAMTDENGVLPADASSDGIHFHKDGYKTWYEYLKTHTVQEEAT